MSRETFQIFGDEGGWMDLRRGVEQQHYYLIKNIDEGELDVGACVWVYGKWI